ncbi:MAG TPA: ATP-binding protein [Gaiellaceae bacterium]|nr:ATP-binding protein [Gaiellaceae bacterium]
MTAAPDWTDGNQRYLMAALEEVRDLLRGEGGPRTSHSDLEDLGRELSSPPALDRVCEAFALSPFERAVLVLCAGAELDSGFPRPTFGLALGALPQPHWSALAPTGPLRRWRLIELEPGEPLAEARLRIDERVLHHLAGVPYLDERLLGLVEPVPAPAGLSSSRRALAGRLAELWTNQHAQASWSPVQLCDCDSSSAREVIGGACEELGLVGYVLQAADVPGTSSERDALARLWEREAALGSAALLIERRDEDPAEAPRCTARLAESVAGPVVLAGGETVPLRTRAAVRLTVPPLSAAERVDFWRASVGTYGAGLDREVDAVAVQFALSGDAVLAAASAALGNGAALWDAAREQARPRVDDLAQRIDPRAGWEDLVLPERQLRSLRDIVVQVRNRSQVYEAWGFASKSARGLGISALFTGPSGTGKTMAAEALAQELRLDLYRIDLSAVVSKYIGETEKNLRRVFDAAEGGAAILLFDEADALFGKRSEVKDSHDRYANIEIGYLLQRMEAYRGLAILTTNMRGALDAAFLRRLRFVVQFPFPDADRRREIWERIFPADTPTEGLDAGRLASLEVAGGSIRNIALNAAFLAADAREPVRMRHLSRAARAEVAKHERPVTDVEIGSWE